MVSREFAHQLDEEGGQVDGVSWTYWYLGSTPELIIAASKRTETRWNRVGGGITPAVPPHHRTYGSVSRRLE